MINVRQECRDCHNYVDRSFSNKKLCNECIVKKRASVVKASKQKRELYLKNDIEMVINHRLTTISKRAFKRKIDFNLTYENVKPYYNKECFYCLKETKDICLDRINSSLGYTLDNIVSCCSGCNSMKWDNSQQDFINKCILIAKNHS